MILVTTTSTRVHLCNQIFKSGKRSQTHFTRNTCSCDKTNFHKLSFAKFGPICLNHPWQFTTVTHTPEGI